MMPLGSSTMLMIACGGLFLAAKTSTVNAQEACEVCTGKEGLRYPDEEICTELLPRTNGMFKTDFDCQTLQLEAYQKGCCFQPPKGDYCGYCADGSEANMDAIVPEGQFVDGMVCFDYMYRNEAYLGIFEDGTCADTFLQRAGHYCGCPDQKQECWLCPDQAPPNNGGKGDGWVTNSNCRGIEFLFSLLKEDECASFPMDAGVDLAIFCGCGGLNQTEIEEQQEIFQCELCRGGGVLLNPSAIYTDGSSDGFVKNCQQADDFARDVVKTPYACNNPNYFGAAREVCCSTDSGAATATAGLSISLSLMAGAAMMAAMVVL